MKGLWMGFLMTSSVSEGDFSVGTYNNQRIATPFVASQKGSNHRAFVLNMPCI